jgi:hypothetical protein
MLQINRYVASYIYLKQTEDSMDKILLKWEYVLKRIKYDTLKFHFM